MTTSRLLYFNGPVTSYSHHNVLWPFRLILLIVSCTHQDVKPDLVADAGLIKTGTDSFKQMGTPDPFSYPILMSRLANGDSSGLWPPEAPLPLPGAILPYKRIVAFYGNFYSKRMGILGELPPEQMMERFKSVMMNWENADSLIPVLPAIHYIAVTAQRQAGREGKYRQRMPSEQMEHALQLAKAMDGLLFLDIQIGASSLREEMAYLEPFLILPQVHLGIDPEFSMKNGDPPGRSIGSFEASDINFVSESLSNLVNGYHLPPKILVVHRFTKGMVTHYEKILKRPEVQLVLNMDGFGFPAKKKNTYYQVIYKEPVQFTGFKLFFKNDTMDGFPMMTPDEILKLKPRPIYIQYQ